jgi:hypothetical protein
MSSGGPYIVAASLMDGTVDERRYKDEAAATKAARRALQDIAVTEVKVLLDLGHSKQLILSLGRQGGGPEEEGQTPLGPRSRLSPLADDSDDAAPQDDGLKA